MGHEAHYWRCGLWNWIVLFAAGVMSAAAFMRREECSLVRPTEVAALWETTSPPAGDCSAALGAGQGFWGDCSWTKTLNAQKTLDNSLFSCHPTLCAGNWREERAMLVQPTGAIRKDV